MLGLQQTRLYPLGALVGNLCYLRVVPEGLWGSRSHHVCENELEWEFNLLIDGRGMSQLVNLAYDAHIAVWHRPVETHPAVIKVFEKA